MDRAVKFAEWIGENHFKMTNTIDGEGIWLSESYLNQLYTTEELYKTHAKEILDEYKRQYP